uniref:Putative salivary triabin 2 n=1 Tax=Panstrongylus lignarius TaxID=156445 RepID=A0A224XU23_9HEMI
MKTFIALTFIGILTYANAQLVLINECKPVTPMEGFKATDFFTGKWYVTQVKYGFLEVCEAFNASKTDDGKYVTEVKYNVDEEEIQVRCEATGEENSPKLSFNCTKTGNDDFQREFIVLGTDYNDYAVIYRCDKMKEGSLLLDNYVVVSRKSDNKEIPEPAKNLTAALGLKKCGEKPLLMFLEKTTTF